MKCISVYNIQTPNNNIIAETEGPGARSRYRENKKFTFL